MSQQFLLSADVGGTHMRVRVSVSSDQSQPTTVSQITLRTEGVDSIKASLIRFATEQLRTHNAAFAAAVIGLPGKISKDRQSCAITQIDPATFVSFSDVFTKVGARRSYLLNDLECGALGIANPIETRFTPLTGTKMTVAVPKGHFVLGMPGTGLGIGIYLEGVGTIASEGGHIPAACDFGDPLEVEVFKAFASSAPKQIHSGVLPSYHLLARGAGLERIYRTLLAGSLEGNNLNQAIQELEMISRDDRPKQIAFWASSQVNCQEGVHTHARQAFAVLGRILGRALQSVALVLLPEGIYLGGDIVLANLPLLENSFVTSFRSHARHSVMLSRCPLYSADNPELNLDGATYYAASSIRNAHKNA